MTDASQERMRAAFNLFDPDGEGKITQEGLRNTMKTLGKTADDSELRTLIGEDVSGMFTARGGKIDFDTFCKIYSGDLKKDEHQITDLQEAFCLLDPKGDKFIDPTVLQFICRRLGEDLTIQEVGAARRAPPASARRAAQRVESPAHSRLAPVAPAHRSRRWCMRRSLALTAASTTTACSKS